VHYALAAGVVSGFGATGSVAVAQDEDMAELERVEVTGSRIKRTDIEGPNPVFVMQREDIESTGLVTIGEILENLPIAGSGLNLNFNNGGNGSILLDLRNLGSSRLLVLVNGRRWVTFPTSAAVDLTTIPTAMIERVEVLKDGASAIYGSDAISGVVNIITRGDFTGAQANVYYGEYDDGDGEQTQADFSIGANSDRGSVFMNINAVDMKPVMAGDRAISAEPTFGTGNAFGSSGTPQGRVFFIDPETGGIRDLTLDRPSEGGQLYPDGAPASAYRPWNGTVDPYNFAPDNYLLTPNERTSIFVQGDYQITDNMSFFSNALYSNRHSAQLLAANPLFIGDFVGDNTVIHEDNPFNPFDIRFGASGGGTPFFIGRRLLEANNRLFTQDSDTFHFTGGFEGSFQMADRFWDWETYYLYQRTEIQETGVGEQNVARVQQALGDPADCTGDCVPLNIFGAAPRLPASQVSSEGLGTITQDMLDYIQASTDEFQFAERTNYAANLTGTLFDLPAGPLGVAVGYEYRREKGRDEPDYLRQTGQLAGNAQAATAGSYSVDEAFVEFAVPILSDMPGVDLLEASLATRYSDYSTFGNTTNSKVGLRWQPYSDLLVRGTYSEGFRAASVGELFQGATDSFLTISDPCSDMLAQAGGDVIGGRDQQQPQNVIDNCIADGVPADGSYRQVNPQIRVTLGGNPDLQPETSESNTFGLVYSPEFVDGLDITLDYFDIEITDSISSIGAQTILNGCYEGGNTNLCQLIERGGGGNVLDLRNVATNIGGTETKGADLGVNYSFPETPVGFFEAQWDTTYVNEYTNLVANQTGGTDANEFVGQQLGDFAIPRIKSNLHLNWSLGDWAANYSMRYIHHMEEDCAISVNFGLCTDPDAVDEDGNPNPRNHLESVLYHDAQVSYHYAPFDTRFTLGARNLFDKDPPLAFTPFANSYDPTTYDVPGRFWYARVTTNF
jgi:outer membrane receptor protein involved in Fe transport